MFKVQPKKCVRRCTRHGASWFVVGIEESEAGSLLAAWSTQLLWVASNFCRNQNVVKNLVKCSTIEKLELKKQLKSYEPDWKTAQSVVRKVSVSLFLRGKRSSLHVKDQTVIREMCKHHRSVDSDFRETHAATVCRVQICFLWKPQVQKSLIHWAWPSIKHFPNQTLCFLVPFCK